MTGPVDVGQTYRYRQTVRDTNGALANAGTVTVTITLPDGSTVSPTVANPSTGVYDISYTTTQPGLHNLFGSATGGILSAEFDKWEDVFTVESSRQVFVGVDEAIAHLRASGAITSEADREQLRWLCLAACDAVERDLGRIIARRTVTELHDGGQSALILRKTPVISVVSVTDSGMSLAASGYTLDTSTGILYRGTSGWSAAYTAGWQSVSVTYVAGYLEPPRAARMVALTVVQNMWQESQQSAHPLIDETSGEAVFSAVGSQPGHLQRAYDSLRAPAVA